MTLSEDLRRLAVLTSRAYTMHDTSPSADIDPFLVEALNLITRVRKSYGAKPSKQRKREAEIQQLKALTEQGAHCGNCAHYEPRPDPGGKGKHCSLKSDFHGYVVTKPDDVCLNWRAKE